MKTAVKIVITLNLLLAVICMLEYTMSQDFMDLVYAASNLVVAIGIRYMYKDRVRAEAAKSAGAVA